MNTLTYQWRFLHLFINHQYILPLVTNCSVCAMFVLSCPVHNYPWLSGLILLFCYGCYGDKVFQPSNQWAPNPNKHQIISQSMQALGPADTEHVFEHEWEHHVQCVFWEGQYHCRFVFTQMNSSWAVDWSDNLQYVKSLWTFDTD